MNEFVPDASWFQGAVSVVPVRGGVMPWRLPYEQKALFPSPGEKLLAFAAIPSGVRIRMRTNATALTLLLGTTPTEYMPGPAEARKFDAVLDNQIVQTVVCAPGERQVRFAGLSGRTHIVEIWLPANEPTVIRAIRVNAGARCVPAKDSRRRWVVYGSSITQCKRAHSPARIWAGTAARHFDMHLTNIGLGGECHLDPMYARLIRDMKADAITLKLGANPYYSSSFNRRTFAPAVIGFVMTIRDRHAETPLLLASPLPGIPHDTERRFSDGMTLSEFREQVRNAYDRLKAATGDRNLYYMDGLDMLSRDEFAADTPDNIHPGPDGIERQSANFLKRMPAGFRKALSSTKPL